MGIGRVRFRSSVFEELLTVEFCKLKLNTKIVNKLLPAPDVWKFKKFIRFNSVFE